MQQNSTSMPLLRTKQRLRRLSKKSRRYTSLSFLVKNEDFLAQILKHPKYLFLINRTKGNGIYTANLVVNREEGTIECSLSFPVGTSFTKKEVMFLKKYEATITSPIHLVENLSHRIRSVKEFTQNTTDFELLPSKKIKLEEEGGFASYDCHHQFETRDGEDLKSALLRAREELQKARDLQKQTELFYSARENYYSEREKVLFEREKLLEEKEEQIELARKKLEKDTSHQEGVDEIMRSEQSLDNWKRVLQNREAALDRKYDLLVRTNLSFHNHHHQDDFLEQSRVLDDFLVHKFSFDYDSNSHQFGLNF